MSLEQLSLKSMSAYRTSQWKCLEDRLVCKYEAQKGNLGWNYRSQSHGQIDGN